MEITNQGAQSFRMEMRNAELNLKGVTVFLQLSAAYCKGIDRTNEGVSLRTTHSNSLKKIILPETLATERLYQG